MVVQEKILSQKYSCFRGGTTKLDEQLTIQLGILKDTKRWKTGLLKVLSLKFLFSYRVVVMGYPHMISDFLGPYLT